MLNLTYNYKIIPTKEQTEKIELNLTVCQSVWNYALAQRKLWYNSRSCQVNACSIRSEYIVAPFEYPNYPTQSANLTQAKKTNDFLKSGNAQAMQQTLRKLERAFNDMKSKGLGFPRFKRNMKFLDKARRKIKLLQRRLKNKDKGSNKWQKLQHRIALLHEAVANRRKDYYFKLAHQLCDGVSSKTAWINCGRCARGQTAQ
ncbi:helix-turn-helix domain-containing protein [Spirulina subsalsa]|uniref:helix-turn-helix domain-containing protein n=1 Tax=Spirulina subsalsa TaxID=54311 RepID=UPI0002E0DA68|nr:helix-turn-helix domain-containing protein [Spirulina subsalsa]